MANTSRCRLISVSKMKMLIGNTNLSRTQIKCSIECRRRQEMRLISLTSKLRKQDTTRKTWKTWLSRTRTANYNTTSEYQRKRWHWIRDCWAAWLFSSSREVRLTMCRKCAAYLGSKLVSRMTNRRRCRWTCEQAIYSLLEILRRLSKMTLIRIRHMLWVVISTAFYL